MKQGIEHADSESGLKAADKTALRKFSVAQQLTHPQVSSALPSAGTADRPSERKTKEEKEKDKRGKLNACRDGIKYQFKINLNSF